MTERHTGYVVTLSDDFREDDAEAIISALKMIKGVLAVDPVPSDLVFHMAYTRARSDLTVKLWDVLTEERRR